MSTDANLATIAMQAETALGITPPAAALQIVRFTKEDLTWEKETATSEEIRSDRQIPDQAMVALAPRGSISFEASHLAILPLIAMVLQADWQTFTATASCTVSGQTITAAAGTFSDIPVGAMVKITGGAAANTGRFRVVGRATDGSTLTLRAGSLSTNETATLTVSGKTISNGTTRKSATIERRLLNNNGKTYYHRFLGMCADTLEIGIESRKIITGQIGFIGTAVTIADGSADATATEEVAASNVLTFSGQPTAGDAVVIGGFSLTFRASADEAGEVTIGGNLGATIANLAAAINGTDDWNESNPFVTCTATTGTTLTVTAIQAGSLGNTITTTESCANASWGSATLTGGVTPVAGYSDPESGEVMNGTSNIGTILIAGSEATTRFKSIRLNLANNLRGKDACGTLGNWDIGSGTFNATAALSAYFVNNDLPAKVLDHTSFALEWTITDASGNALTFYLPCVKIAGTPSITGINTDVMIEGTIQAMLGTAAQNPTGKTLIIDAYQP